MWWKSVSTTTVCLQAFTSINAIYVQDITPGTMYVHFSFHLFNQNVLGVYHSPILCSSLKSQEWIASNFSSQSLFPLLWGFTHTELCDRRPDGAGIWDEGWTHTGRASQISFLSVETFLHEHLWIFCHPPRGVWSLTILGIISIIDTTEEYILMGIFLKILIRCLF